MDAGSPQLLLVTVDTNLLDEHRIADLRSSAEGTTVEFATVTVNERERGVPHAGLRVVPDTLVWDESRWDEAVWGGPIPELMVLDETPLGSGVLASDAGVDLFEKVLSIVSNGIVPEAGGP